MTMLRRLMNNRKGTAEVIGSVMFIVILLFFFTNVYLWHDAATKEMNDLYVQKINTPISAKISSENSGQLNVTNNGGLDVTLSAIWVDLRVGSTDTKHEMYPLNTMIPAGASSLIDIGSYYNPSQSVKFKVVTTTGNIAACTNLP